MTFKTHAGPLVQGDLIVIEYNGKLIPKRPDDPRPQWFVVLENQKGSERVRLEPFNDESPRLFARKYVVGGVWI